MKSSSFASSFATLFATFNLSLHLIKGNEIEIGFLKTNLIRGNLAVETFFLDFYGNVLVMKNV